MSGGALALRPSRGKKLLQEAPHDVATVTAGELSPLERLIFTHPPVIESVLAYLPTSAILDLYATSRYLRSFLSSYPLAWKTLSFRLPQPAVALARSPGHETPDGRERQSKQHKFNALIVQVVIPFATCLTSLDLCNTAISGVALVSRVLEPRIDSIQHLSVRGCKNGSIKYHIVPFLQQHSPFHSPWIQKADLALKSLYTYRCRHHRRRPYLPSSLHRGDSDSEPTHELIEICHLLGIWTDTAWCPTPGGRCFRRKEYYSSRAPPGASEVWVPFDRLWRSGNHLGSPDRSKRFDGRTWEEELGYDGEPLGTTGDGKGVPAHQRRSHRIFVDTVKCEQCGDQIMERCEQCSIRMHCMACRKSLCASCAFNRPLPRKRAKTRHFGGLAFGGTALATTSTAASPSSSPDGRQPNAPKRSRFWWAPGAARSPNLLTEVSEDDDTSDSDDSNANNGTITFNHAPPKLNMYWCCIEPIFSGGGGIAVLGPSVGGAGATRIRAVPLPRGQGYEDPDFRPFFDDPPKTCDGKQWNILEYVTGADIDIASYLQQDHIDLQATVCPRSLCQECYKTFRWKVSCRACKKPLCKEHDFRALKVRKCGFRNLHIERDYVRSRSWSNELRIPAYRSPPTPSSMASSSSDFPPSYEESQESSSMTRSTSTTPRPPPHIDLSQSQAPFNMSLTLSERLAGRIGPFATRPRSHSLSGMRGRMASPPWAHTPLAAQSPIRAPITEDRVPLPCSYRHPVQWQGCGAYFCLADRGAGDCRPRCTATMKECGECGVLACEFCLADNPPCPCGYCSTSYHCPNCAAKPSIRGRCRREEERKARLAAQLAEEDRKRKRAERNRQADILAECLQEFFVGVMDPEIDDIDAFIDEDDAVPGAEMSPSDVEAAAAAVLDADGPDEFEAALDALLEGTLAGGMD